MTTAEAVSVQQDLPDSDMGRTGPGAGLGLCFLVLALWALLGYGHAFSHLVSRAARESGAGREGLGLREVRPRAEATQLPAAQVASSV